MKLPHALLLVAAIITAVGCASIRSDEITCDAAVSVWYQGAGMDPVFAHALICADGRIAFNGHRGNMNDAAMARLHLVLSSPLLGAECARAYRKQHEDLLADIESATCRARIPYEEMGSEVRSLLVVVQESIWEALGDVRPSIEWPGDWSWSRLDLLNVGGSLCEGEARDFFVTFRYDGFVQLGVSGSTFGSERDWHAVLGRTELEQLRFAVAAVTLPADDIARDQCTDGQPEMFYIRTPRAVAHVRCDAQSESVKALSTLVQKLVRQYFGSRWGKLIPCSSAGTQK